MTNYEKIKQMSIEEMSDFLNDLDSGGICTLVHVYCNKIYGGCVNSECKKGLYKWLESEAEK